MAIPILKKKKKYREEWGKREKEEKGEKEGKEDNSIQREGQFPYFVSLFNIGPYDRQKKSEKGKNFNKKSRLKIFLICYTTASMFMKCFFSFKQPNSPQETLPIFFFKILKFSIYKSTDRF